MIKITLINRNKYPINSGEVKKIAEAAALKIKQIKGRIEIALVSDREIKKLNRIWRKIDRATDVLAFAWNEEKLMKSEFLGQLVISYPKIVSQAKEYGVPVIQEFRRIFVHGLLHLAGYEHIKKNEAEKMFSLQEKIIKNL